MSSLRILILFLLITSSVQGQRIKEYQCFYGWGIIRPGTKEVIILRKFERESQCFYFTVAPNTLETAIFSSDSLAVHPAGWDEIFSRYNSTAYCLALKQAENLDHNIQDAGFTRFKPSQKGIDLTIDLCPSNRPLDRIVFIDLIEEMGKIEMPVPVTISITGKWINTHTDDLKWLDSLSKAGKLSIVWMNHSYNHFTGKNIPLKSNFLLAPGTDINSEVINTEIALIERHIVPSVFFRFPGLVSDTRIYKEILEFGLVPVGSDAWLAKGQWPENGSIVLIHANGNEPLGIHDFINLLKTKVSDVLSGKWELYDLRESLVDEEEK